MFELFKVGKPNKKASLDLSINVIIIVVLAMTLLGLGLGFIRGMFKDITDTTSQVSEQVRQSILDVLRTGDKKLAFPSNEVSIDRGSSEILAFGVKNTRDAGEIKFGIIPTVLQVLKPGQEPAVANTTNPITDITFFYDSTVKTLKVDEADVYTINSIAKGGKGTYLVQIIICEADEDGVTITQPCAAEKIYAEKSFYVNVI